MPSARKSLVELAPLRRGAHPSREQGWCAMELVAYLAGEPHSDEPQCACPVLTSVTRAMNDALDDAWRESLVRPLVPLLVRSRAAALQTARGYLLLDAMLRELAPLQLMQQEEPHAARALRALAAVHDAPSCANGQAALLDCPGQLREVRWAFRLACQGVAGQQFVTAAVQQCQRLGTRAGWLLLQDAVHRAALLRPVFDAANASH